MLLSITPAMCNRVFPAEERGKALGINAIFVSLGLSMGPSFSGMLMASFGWRAVFFFNFPFAFIGAVMAILILKKDEFKPISNRRLDVPGSLLFAVFISLLTIALNFSVEWGFASLNFFGCLILSLLALALFIIRESRTDMPLMKLDLYKNPIFVLANGASVCSYLLQNMTTFLTPFFLINILLIPKSISGFIMLSTPIGMMILSPFGGRLTDRYGSRRPALIGLLLIAAGCVSMSFMSTSAPGFLVAAAIFLNGAGNGLSVPAINSSIFGAVPREHSGMASGVVATLRNFGQSLGVACGSTIIALRQSYYYARAAEGGSGASNDVMVYMQSQRDAFYFGLFIVAIAILCMIRTSGKSTDAKPDNQAP